MLALLIPQLMAWDKIQTLLGAGIGVISHSGCLGVALPLWTDCSVSACEQGEGRSWRPGCCCAPWSQHIPQACGSQPAASLKPDAERCFGSPSTWARAKPDCGERQGKGHESIFLTNPSKPSWSGEGWALLLLPWGIPVRGQWQKPAAARHVLLCHSIPSLPKNCLGGKAAGFCWDSPTCSCLLN